MKEIWKKLAFNQLYQISNKGRVKSTRYGEPKILRCKNLNGYMVLTITVDGEKTAFRVHRLVAEYFVPNPANKEFVNHIDGVKNNNRHTNLEWLTHKENITHYHANNHDPESCALCRKHQKHLDNLKRFKNLTPT